MNVADLMTRDPATCASNTPLREVARMMVERDCGAIPVVDEQTRPIGIVTDRDIVTRAVASGENPLEHTAGDCMTPGCVTVTEEMSAELCCQHLEERQIRRAVVVDGDGRCIGIVAQADVARHSEMLAAEVVTAVSLPGRNGVHAPGV